MDGKRKPKAKNADGDAVPNSWGHIIRAKATSPDSAERPTWLRNAYQGVAELAKKSDPVPHIVRGKIVTWYGKCWPYFYNTVLAYAAQVQEVQGEISRERLAEIFGITVAEVDEDIEQGRLPTILQGARRIIDTDALYEQLLAEVIAPCRIEDAKKEGGVRQALTVVTMKHPRPWGTTYVVFLAKHAEGTRATKAVGDPSSKGGSGAPAMGHRSSDSTKTKTADSNQVSALDPEGSQRG